MRLARERMRSACATRGTWAARRVPFARCPQRWPRRRPPYGGTLDAELAEQVSDLADLAARFVSEDVSEQDAKYMAQRAYNAHRSKRAYEAKLSRRSQS